MERGDGEEDHCFATLILVFGILVGLKFLLIVSVGQEAAGEKGGIKILEMVPYFRVRKTCLFSCQ